MKKNKKVTNRPLQAEQMEARKLLAFDIMMVAMHSSDAPPPMIGFAHHQGFDAPGAHHGHHHHHEQDSSSNGKGNINAWEALRVINQLNQLPSASSGSSGSISNSIGIVNSPVNCGNTTPTESTDPTTPTEGTDTSTPTDSTDTSTPTDSTDTSSPTDSTDTSSPTDSTDTSTPTDSTDTSAPSDSTDTSTPTDSTDTSTPTDSTDTSAPSDSTDTSTPTDSTDTSTPSDSTDTSAPSDCTDTSAPSDSTDTSAPSDSTDTSAPSDSTDTSAPSDSTDTSTPSDSTDTSTPSDGTTTDDGLSDILSPCLGTFPTSTPTFGTTADLFDRIDANDDGNIESNEVPEKLWNLLKDSASDTTAGVTEAGFSSFVDSLPDSVPPPHHGMHPVLAPPGQLATNVSLFDQLDTSKDDKITSSELPASLWQGLVVSDKNADGSIDRSELDAHIQSARDKFFARLDANGDSSITLEDVGAELWAPLSKTDKDGSGGVSLTEFSTYTDNMFGSTTLKKKV